MKIKRSTTLLMSAILSTALLSTITLASQEDTDYCVAKNGTVETMTPTYQTSRGLKYGFPMEFCTFHLDGGFAVVGLKTFSSTSPNIAASFIKTLAKVEHDSPLWKGKYATPAINVCKNLGGADIHFNNLNGGYESSLGQVNVCVFGDGSAVSPWSLIYIANGRNQYNLIKEAIRSEPLHVGY